jgi:hypothetical protein
LRVINIDVKPDERLESFVRLFIYIHSPQLRRDFTLFHRIGSLSRRLCPARVLRVIAVASALSGPGSAGDRREAKSL